MASKVHFNLKNVHYAVRNANGSYGTPVHIPGGVEFTADPVGETTVFWADGIQYFVGHSNNGYEGTIELAKIPDDFRVNVLQEILDARGIIVEKQNFKTVYFALGFQIDGDDTSTYFWYYNCSASRPAQNASTNEESKEVQTETLEWSCSPDASGLIRSKTGDTATITAAEWFQEVYMPLDSVVKSASGTMITLSDAIHAALNSAVVYRKNLIPYPFSESTKTENGITFTVGSGGTVRVNGTATANTRFYLTSIAAAFCLPKGKTYRVVMPDGIRIEVALYNGNTFTGTVHTTTTSKTFTLPNDNSFDRLSIYLNISNGDTVSNVTTHPYIRLDSDPDTTFASYTSTAKVYVTGRNLFPAPYDNGSKTDSGVYWTVNADGTININGTATAANYLLLHSRATGVPLPAGTYTATGCPSGGGTTTYRTMVAPGDAANVYDSDAGASFTINNGKVGMQLNVTSGYTADNVTFKPMIKLSSDTNTDYEAYSGIEYTANLDADGNICNLGEIWTKTGLNNIFTDQSAMEITYRSNSI